MNKLEETNPLRDFSKQELEQELKRREEAIRKASIPRVMYPNHSQEDELVRYIQSYVDHIANDEFDGDVEYWRDGIYREIINKFIGIHFWKWLDKRLEGSI